MQKSVVEKKQTGIRTDKYLQELYPSLAFGMLQKTFRKRDVKVNGIRVRQDHTLSEGDTVEIFLTDDLLGLVPSSAANSPKDISPKDISLKDISLKDISPRDMSPKDMFSIVFEDYNIIIVNKNQGISVHAGRDGDSHTLIDLVGEYLGFQPSLCHRLDRNTGGLVMIAKNKESLDLIIDCMDKGVIRKYYQCLVKGEMAQHNAILTGWLVKDENRSRVFICEEKVRGSLEIITKYKVVEYDAEADISRLEVELVTGRTHQIRAHFASLGHPVIGDGKYGLNSINRPLKLKHQALWAYKLEFVFNGKDAGRLNYLNGMVFQVEPGFPTIEALKGR